MIRYDGLGDLGSWGDSGEKRGRGGYLLGRVESALSGLLYTVHYHWTQGSRIQTSGLSFLKLTHSSLGKSRFRLTL